MNKFLKGSKMANSENISQTRLVEPSRRIGNWWNRVEIGRRATALWSIANSVRMSQRLARLSQDHHFGRTSNEPMPEDDPMEMRIGDQFDIKIPEPKSSNTLGTVLTTLALVAAGAGVTWGIMQNKPSDVSKPIENPSTITDTDTNTQYDVELR